MRVLARESLLAWERWFSGLRCLLPNYSSKCNSVFETRMVKEDNWVSQAHAGSAHMCMHTHNKWNANKNNLCKGSYKHWPLRLFAYFYFSMALQDVNCVNTGKGELEVNSHSHLYGLFGAFIWLRICWENSLGACLRCLLPFSLTLRKRQILTDDLRLFLEVKIESAQAAFSNNQA